MWLHKLCPGGQAPTRPVPDLYGLWKRHYLYNKNKISYTLTIDSTCNTIKEIFNKHKDEIYIIYV